MSTLFRQEAIDSRRRSAFGSVTIHQPVAFGVMTSAIVAIVAGIVVFMATAPFAKKETAPGWIVPQGGMAQVYAPQGALIQTVLVRPGQRVAKGQVLATSSTDTYNATGATGEQERQQIAAQERDIDAQIAASHDRLMVSARHARDQISALQAEAVMLTGERQLQSEQLKVTQQQLKDIQPIVKKGFISKFEQDRRVQEGLSLQQAVSGVDRQIKGQEAQVEAARSDLADATDRQAAEEAQLRASQANLRASRVAIDYRTGATLRAPIAGTVATINSHPGETAQSSLAVVSVAPAGPVEVELLLPTRAAGLVEPGQSVRLYVDAFPYQRYGAMRGVIEEIGRAAVGPTEYAAPIPFKEASYRVRVRLLQGLMRVDGSQPQIQVGMTLNASIIADKRTMLQWLIDPLRGR